nr:hypothetical protein [Tanacetum cinerariifolium]
MLTLRSVRTSPLAYDPKVERSARLRRKVVRKFSTNLDFAGLKELFTEMSDDEATRAESLPRGVDSYYRLGNFEDPSPIVYPAAANGVVSNFKIQLNLIAILPVFRGHEEPYAHLREFFSIADTYQVNNTTKDGVRLRLFPFSLKDQAKAWFTSLEPGIRLNPCQIPSEQFHEAFSRLKELLRTCPHHDVPKWELVKVFYDGLDYHNQQFVMATSGGTFFSWPIEEECKIFEKLSKGSKTQASVDRNNNHTSSASFVSNRHGINSKTSELSKKVDLLLKNLGKGVSNVLQVSHNACLICHDPSHSVNNYQSWGAPSNEEVNGVYGNCPQNDPFFESYNPGWRNHSNFRWKDDNNYNRPNNTQQQNHGYIPRPQPNKNQGQGLSNGQQSNIDQKFDLILSELAKSNQGANLKFESLSKSVVNLERQMGQLAAEDFVTDDEIIAEGKKADNVKFDSKLVNDLLKDFPKPPTQNSEATESSKVGEGGVSSTTTPYPAALEKSASARLAKKGPYSKDMWETFKKLKASLRKRIDLTEHVSAVLSSSLPPKFKDPRAPLILVMVGNITIKKVFLDLGASINILPASLVDKYDLGTLRKTNTIISLADRSTKIPRGILEYVIVKVDDFYYPVDFFVMDTESPYKDVQPNIILGRRFLATIDARINYRTGAMDIAFGYMGDLKQVKINSLLIDAIKQIPTYVKFLKDLCTQKMKLKATLPKKIDLTEHVSAVLSSSLPPKFKDP